MQTELSEPEPGPFACYKLTQVTLAGEKNHPPAQSLCRECEHGRAGVLHYIPDPERQADARSWLASHRMNSVAVKPCKYLYVGLPEQLRAPALIVTPQAFSDAVTQFDEIDLDTGRVARSTRRLVVVDESIQPAQEIVIKAGDVELWRDRLPRLADRLDDDAERADD